MTSGRLDTPSNFSTSRNTILLTGRLSPIPIASVDTTTCVFFSLKSVICLRLISGGRLPYMTLGFMPFSSRRPAILSTDFFENTIKASPSFTSCGNENGLSSSFRAVFLSYSLISYSSWHRLIRWTTTSFATGLMHIWISPASVPRIALVHECPLSSSATICASSITAISYSLSQSSISTVDAVILLSDTSRHSWPVSMVHGMPASFIFSYTSSARSLRGPRYTPFCASLSLSSAWYVLPLLVGPIWSMKRLFMLCAFGNSSSGRAGTSVTISLLSSLLRYSL